MILLPPLFLSNVLIKSKEILYLMEFYILKLKFYAPEDVEINNSFKFMDQLFSVLKVQFAELLYF